MPDDYKHIQRNNLYLKEHPSSAMSSKDPKEEKRERAREVVDILEEISILLVSALIPCLHSIST